MKPARLVRVVVPVACLLATAGCSSPDSSQQPQPPANGSSSAPADTSGSTGPTDEATTTVDGTGTVPTDSTDTSTEASSDGATGTATDGTTATTGQSSAGGHVTHAASGTSFDLPDGWRATGEDALVATGTRKDGFMPNLLVTPTGSKTLPTRQQLEKSLNGRMRLEDMGQIDTPLGPAVLGSTAGTVKGVEVHGAVLIVVGPKGATAYIISDTNGGAAKRTATTIARSLKADGS